MVVLWLILCALFSTISLTENKERNGNQEGSGLLGKLSTEPSTSSLNTYKGPTIHPSFTSDLTSAYKGLFNDTEWDRMWYVQDYRTVDMPVMDLNVVPVYKQGITGKGVTIAVVDGAINAQHPDLAPNYLEELSFDAITRTKGSVIPGKKDTHATKSAGIIAMVANNTRCGVGIAYNSKVAGIINHFQRGNSYVDNNFNSALSLVTHLDRFDIYSNSWGSDDDGKSMEDLNKADIVRFAMNKGATKGRNGKGAIYTFASGNGRSNLDNCGADFVVNAEHSIAIASASQFGRITSYGETCAGIMATTYGGSMIGLENIQSISLGRTCADCAGTSAATPLATGIIALVLEANSELTNRDISHLITMGSEVAPLANNKHTWKKNGKGFWVSHHFGFGLMNAANMVKLAKEWVNVPKKRSCVFDINFKQPEQIKVTEVKNIMINVGACKGTEDEVNYLETIQLTPAVSYAYRGSISVHITSPKGTKVLLLGNRPNDYDPNGLDGWALKSVHTWGEDPNGVWNIQISIHDTPRGWFFSSPIGLIKSFRFAIHGTKEQPEHYKKPRVRTYAAFRLPNGRTSEK